MVVKTYTSLENQISSLKKENQILKESNAKFSKANYELKREIKKIKDNMDDLIEEKLKQEIEKFTKELIIENVKLKEEVNNLKKLLNVYDNQNTPTSKTPLNKNKKIPNTREKTDKVKGGQKGHTKNKLLKFNDEEITEKVKHMPTICSCGCSNLKIHELENTKDSYEIEFNVKKIRNEFYSAECQRCKKIINCKIPINLKEENQYGNSVNSLIISLLNEGLVSINRTKKFIEGITNNELSPSEGYISKVQKKTSNKLDEFINDLKRKIIGLPLVCWDDTEIRINTKRSCLRFYGNENIALYTAHLTKGKSGLDEDDILKQLSKDTVVMHDHNIVNYNKDYEFQNSECNRHLIGDIKKVYLETEKNWCKDMIELLSKTNNLRNEKIETKEKFDDDFIKEFYLKFNTILQAGLDGLKINFKQEINAREKTLLERIKDYKTEYLLWLIRFDIPFTNNVSERGLRMSKSKMKISGQFENINTARYYANIRTYIETCKRNKINTHIALVKLFDGNPYSVDDIFPTKNE